MLGRPQFNCSSGCLEVVLSRPKDLGNLPAHEGSVISLCSTSDTTQTLLFSLYSVSTIDPVGGLRCYITFTGW